MRYNRSALGRSRLLLFVCPTVSFPFFASDSESPGYLIWLALLPLIGTRGWPGMLDVLAVPCGGGSPMLFRTLVWTGVVRGPRGRANGVTSDRVTVIVTCSTKARASRKPSAHPAMLDSFIHHVAKTFRNDSRGGQSRVDRVRTRCHDRNPAVQMMTCRRCRRLESLLERTDATIFESGLEPAQASIARGHLAADRDRHDANETSAKPGRCQPLDRRSNRHDIVPNRHRLAGDENSSSRKLTCPRISAKANHVRSFVS